MKGGCSQRECAPLNPLLDRVLGASQCLTFETVDGICLVLLNLSAILRALTIRAQTLYVRQVADFGISLAITSQCFVSVGSRALHYLGADNPGNKGCRQESAENDCGGSTSDKK